MFDGKYHGHGDELLGRVEGAGLVAEGDGLVPDALRHVRIAPYNDLEAVGRECSRITTLRASSSRRRSPTRA
jgi:glutamate-1-semialdehyde aminotransferase